MQSPFTGGDVILKVEKRTHVYRNQEFTINANYYECVDTKETFTDEALDNLNITQLHNLYRERNKIPFPEQIKALREKYGLSQRTMSLIMGFGVNQYRNYEDGEIPSLSNAKLINLAREPMNFKELVLEKKEELRDQDLSNITRRINELIASRSRPEALFEHVWHKEDFPNQYTGYRVPDFEKFAYMIVYLYQKVSAYTTKMNKLVFYSDFLHYKRFGFSISGMPYCAIKMGPVPDNYRTLNDLLVQEGYLESTVEHFKGDLVEVFRPAIHADESHFTARELDILNLVAGKFKNTSTQQIIDISHREAAWKDNVEQKAGIDYQKYAFQLLAFQ